MKIRLASFLALLALVGVIVYPALNHFKVVEAAPGSITTMFAGGNNFAGNMFDVTALTDITITSFDVNVGTGGVGCLISVYYRPGTYVGNTSSSVGWTLLGSDTVNSAGTNVPTPVNVGGLSIPTGQTYGLYVTVSNYATCSMQYTNGTLTTSNADIQLDLGIGKGNPDFTGANFDPRIWNGTIYYTTGTTGYQASGNYAKIGQIRVTAPGTALYEEAGGNVLRSAGGAEVWVPNATAHNPNEDTYDVLAQTTLGNVTWVQIFVGDANFPVWVAVGGGVQIIEIVE